MKSKIKDLDCDLKIHGNNLETSNNIKDEINEIKRTMADYKDQCDDFVVQMKKISKDKEPLINMIKQFEEMKRKVDALKIERTHLANARNDAYERMDNDYTDESLESLKKIVGEQAMKIQNSKSNMETKRNEYDKVSTMLNDKQNVINELNMSKGRINEQISNFERKLTQLIGVLKDMKRQYELNGLNDIPNNVDGMKNNIGLSKNCYEMMSRILNDNKNELSSCENEMKQSDSLAENALNLLKQKKIQYETTKREKLNQLNALKTKIKINNNQLTAFSKQLNNLSNIDDEINTKQNEYDNYVKNNSSSKYQKMVDDMTKKIRNYDNKINELNDEISALSNQQSLYSSLNIKKTELQSLKDHFANSLNFVYIVLAHLDNDTSLLCLITFLFASAINLSILSISILSPLNSLLIPDTVLLMLLYSFCLLYKLASNLAIFVFNLLTSFTLLSYFVLFF